MYFQAPPVMKGKEKFYYEVNIDETYGKGIVDEWGAAYVWNQNGVGAEYNICYDGKDECSAIYKMDEDSTDPTTFHHYEIDFSFDDWKQRLINAMVDCVERWWKSEKRDEY